MKGYIVCLCTNCNSFTYEKDLGRYPVCGFCHNEWYNTGIEDDEWTERFIDANPKYKRKRNFSGKQVHNFARQVLTEEGKLHLNPVAVQAYEDNQDRLRNQAQQRIASTPRCPKCGSTNLGKTKRGFSTGRAVAAGMLTGFLDVAAVAGAAGSNKMVNCCNECGHTWK